MANRRPGRPSPSPSPHRTTFDELPDLVKEQIFKTLDSDPAGNLNNSRLVCKDWYIFLATHSFKTCGTATDENAAKSLQILESSFQPEFSQLIFKNCIKPLPILSSTRVKFPPTRTVIVQEGNSEVNLRALLRYYCVSPTTRALTLVGHCFQTCSLKFIKTNPKQAFRFQNLTTLSLICCLPVANAAPAHWNAVNGFLSHVRIDNLTTFSVRQNCFTAPADEVMRPNWTNFLDSMTAFVKNHGEKIRSLHVCFLACRYAHILSLIPHLNVLTNLEEFRCSYTGSKMNNLRLLGSHEEKLELNSEFEKLFKSLSRLSTLVLMTADQELKFADILDHASPRLRILSLYVRGFSQLSWIHQHARLSKGSSVELLDLYFSVRNNPFAAVLNTPACLKYKLLNLQVLKLLLFRDSTRPPMAPEDVYDDCVRWIIQFTPNVRRLQLSFYSDKETQHEMSLDQMKRLLTEAKRLEELTWNQIINYGMDKRGLRLDLDTEPMVQQLRGWCAESTNQKGITISIRRTKNYHYTNFTDGTDEVVCVRVNREVFEVY